MHSLGGLDRRATVASPVLKCCWEMCETCALFSKFGCNTVSCSVFPPGRGSFISLKSLPPGGKQSTPGGSFFIFDKYPGGSPPGGERQNILLPPHTRAHILGQEMAVCGLFFVGGGEYLRRSFGVHFFDTVSCVAPPVHGNDSGSSSIFCVWGETEQLTVLLKNVFNCPVFSYTRGANT